MHTNSDPPNETHIHTDTVTQIYTYPYNRFFESTLEEHPRKELCREAHKGPLEELPRTIP